MIDIFCQDLHEVSPVQGIGKFRWQNPPQSMPVNARNLSCSRPASSFARRSQNCLICTRNRTPGTPASEWVPTAIQDAPCQRGRNRLNYCHRRRLAVNATLPSLDTVRWLGRRMPLLGFNRLWLHAVLHLSIRQKLGQRATLLSGTRQPLS
jgi:hypothetical protein